MNERQTQLSEQLVASKHWRWMPGMLTTSVDGPGLRVETVDATDPSIVYVGDLPWFVSAPPDLDDPATIGCLLALVREAWGDHVWIRWWRDIAPRMEGDRGGCEVVDGVGRSLFAGPRVLYPTEAEALAAALIEAP